MPDDTKVFDVSKPGRSAPTPTSRPVIVTQRPENMDSTVNGPSQPAMGPPDVSGTPIHVSMADEEPVNVMTQPSQPSTSPINEGQNQEHFPPAPSGATIPPHELDQPNQPERNGAGSNFTPLSNLIPNVEGKGDTGSYGSHHVDNLPESHPGEPGWREAPPMPTSKGAGPKRRWPKVLMWLFFLLLLAAAGAYLAIDDGLIKSDIKLPYHIFNKQKTSTTTTPPPPVKSTQPVSQPPAESSVPVGFTSYKVADANTSFAYPTAWGAPVVTKDPGFSKRGGTNKTDGTHAYLIDFPTNKDVEVALTSSKYLPATNSARYFDFLQWCTGTNDGKYYKQTLHYITDSTKVDTPSTIVCDQGPLTDATKLDDTTIIQQKTGVVDSAATPKPTIADLYTKNLASKDITVLHVKDVSMKNSDNIKKLLTTVKLVTATSSSNSNSVTL
jgi:hypothetical protein